MSQYRPSTTTLSHLSGVCCAKVVSWVGSCAERDRSVEVARELARSESGSHRVVLCLDAPCHRPLTPEAIGAAQARLARLYRHQSPALVVPGHPLDEIRRYARTHAVDLLVMGEQGLALEQQYQERICDDAPCAVVILILPRRPLHHTPEVNR